MKKPQISKLKNNLKSIKTPPISKVNLALSTVAIILSASSILFAGYTYLYRPTKTIENPTNSITPTFTEHSVTEVVNQVSPSVVSILTETTSYGWFGPNTTNGAGTGVIVSKNGYIITNKHVVKNINRASIVKADGTLYENVPVVDIDPVNDIAFLKIPDVDNLPAATLGDSKNLKPGQPVIAIGNALGEFQNTVTNGIISGTGRSITASDSSRNSQERLTDMIQTNASINPGNSGGPLVSADGKVIGINTAVSSNGQGIGFAIPISSVKGLINQLINTGKAQRAYLGINYININASTAKTYNLPVKSGAYIFAAQKYSAIISGSPADKAGIKDKDIITAINGVTIGKQGSVNSLLGEYSVGDTITINILRSGKEMSLQVKLEAFPQD